MQIVQTCTFQLSISMTVATVAQACLKYVMPGQHFKTSCVLVYQIRLEHLPQLSSMLPCFPCWPGWPLPGCNCDCCDTVLRYHRVDSRRVRRHGTQDAPATATTAGEVAEDATRVARLALWLAVFIVIGEILPILTSQKLRRLQLLQLQPELPGQL